MECREGLETCVNDQCECTGDCNLDGVVTIVEVQTAINILGDVLPLSECPAASQNGEVVNIVDIQIAITNLGLGCPAVRPPMP